MSKAMKDYIMHVNAESQETQRFESYVRCVLNEAIRQWVERAGENAKAHGFHDMATPATNLANIHAEVSEAWEVWRSGCEHDPSEKCPGITMMAEEVADIVIRCFDFCYQNNIDLGQALQVKHEYNRGRPHLHGGKRA